MKNLPTPYELADLAARIAPELCANYIRRPEAIRSALSLIDAADRALKAHETQLAAVGEMEAEHEKHREFLRKYKIPETGKTPLTKAAVVIMGMVERRRPTESLAKLEKLIRLDSIHRPDDVGGPYDADEQIAKYTAEGMSCRSILYWRVQAEKNDFCKNKFLTGDLRENAEDQRETSKSVALPKSKAARKSRKSARKGS